MKKLLRLAERIARFPSKSWWEMTSSLVTRWNRWFPGLPQPILRRDGIWWVFDGDYVSVCALNRGYENQECNFERRYVTAGMTVLDIGAHCGFHTLLLSKNVGPRGRVLACEPSPSNRKRLRLHLAINFRRNVCVLPWALGEKEGSGTLFEVKGNTVLNSLRLQASMTTTTPTMVAVRSLDKVLSELRIEKVDFVKLDVEGAELAVLKGAEQFLSVVPRPVILCEVQEETTRAWGYSAREIVELLARKDFVWFGLNDKGELVPTSEGRGTTGRNLVAVPKELLSVLAHLRKTASDDTSESEFNAFRGHR